MTSVKPLYVNFMWGYIKPTTSKTAKTMDKQTNVPFDL